MVKRDYCTFCKQPLFDFHDHAVCKSCEFMNLTGFYDCPRCGRYVDYTFDCEWCAMRVCDGCVHREHNDDYCSILCY